MIKALKSLYYFTSKRYKNLFLEYQTDFKPRYPIGKPHPGLQNIIERNNSIYADLLGKCLNYKEFFYNIKKAKEETNAHFPGWNNDFLPGLDIVMLYTILAEYKPKKYIEVGSGNSTKVSYLAKTQQKIEMQIVSIDPFPRAEIDSISDVIYRKRFEDMDLAVLEQLQANDVLFIDNSHRMLPNSDSTVFYLDALPLLKKGVIVHIHDIYLPYDYPQFMCDRFYSEQYGLACYLLSNPDKFKVIAPNFYISETKELATKLDELWNHSNLSDVEKHGGSFWFQVMETE